VAHSGWPFSRRDLDPYYARAHQVLKLGSVRYDTASWVDAIGRRDVRNFPLRSSGVVRDAISQFSPPVRMGLHYRSELKGSRHVSIYLHANLTQVHTDADGLRVTSVTAKTLDDRIVNVRAQVFILATGGIENARLLLACSPRHPGGLGNAHDLVGRYFMDHPRVLASNVNFNAAWRRNKLYDHKFHYQNPAVSAGGVRVASLAGDLATIAASPIDSLGYVAARLFQPVSLIKGVTMFGVVEAAPDPLSRVTLSKTSRDALGVPRPVVEWRLNDQVKRTFDRSFGLVAESSRPSASRRSTGRRASKATNGPTRSSGKAHGTPWAPRACTSTSASVSSMQTAAFTACRVSSSRAVRCSRPWERTSRRSRWWRWHCALPTSCVRNCVRRRSSGMPLRQPSLNPTAAVRRRCTPEHRADRRRASAGWGVTPASPAGACLSRRCCLG